MHNLFISSDRFDWKRESKRVQMANRMLEATGVKARVRAPGSTGQQTSVEMRSNIYHLLSQVLAYQVPGEIIEVGTYTGETAVLMQNVIDGEDPSRRLHVYDSFESSWGSAVPLEDLKQNFRKYSGKLPRIHQGRFEKVMPQELPDRIALVHLDCGFGGPPAEHEAVLRFVLTHIYPRLSPGAICSIVDYWDADLQVGVPPANPGVKPALDGFLVEKPERVSALYAGEYAHGYFRRRLYAPAQVQVSHQVLHPMQSDPALLGFGKEAAN